VETPTEVIARGTGDRLQHVGLTQQHLQTQERKDQASLKSVRTGSTTGLSPKP